MRIAVVNSYIPFIREETDALVDALTTKLGEYGHNVTLVKIPFTCNSLQEIFDHLIAVRSLHFKYFFDLVIPLNFPSYHIKHPKKVLWLLDYSKPLRSLLETKFHTTSNISNDLHITKKPIDYDNLYLKETKKIFTASQPIFNQLKKFNNCTSEILYPPLINAENYYCNDYGNYLFFPIPINDTKGQYLAVESMKHTKSNVELIIAGHVESKKDLINLQSTINQNGLSNKVKVIDRLITEEEKIKLMADSLGCIYAPYTGGYQQVTLEAQYSQKPIITCTDSEGTNIFIENHVTGLVVPPDPKLIAENMDKLYLDKRIAERIGKSGLERIQSLDITWNKVIEKLIK